MEPNLTYFKGGEARGCLAQQALRGKPALLSRGEQHYGPRKNRDSHVPKQTGIGEDAFMTWRALGYWKTIYLTSRSTFSHQLLCLLAPIFSLLRFSFLFLSHLLQVQTVSQTADVSQKSYFILDLGLWFLNQYLLWPTFYFCLYFSLTIQVTLEKSHLQRSIWCWPPRITRTKPDISNNQICHEQGSRTALRIDS